MHDLADGGKEAEEHCAAEPVDSAALHAPERHLVDDAHVCEDKHEYAFVVDDDLDEDQDQHRQVHVELEVVYVRPP